MHIRITNKHTKNQSTDKFLNAFFADFRSNHFGDITVAGALILPFRVNPEYLREILTMDYSALFRPVEAFDGKRRAFQSPNPFRRS